VFSNFFPLENRAVDEEMGKKYFRAEQAIDDNKAHVHCVLDT
jgi:hypothetical protein